MVLLAFVLVLLSALPAKALWPQGGLARDGVAVVPSLDFSKPADLGGRWGYRFGALLPPEEAMGLIEAGALNLVTQFWHGDGYATYALRVHLPQATSGLALRVPEINSAWRLYVNGRELAGRGTVATTRAEERVGYVATIVPLPRAATLDIVLHVSNHTHFEGGIGRALALSWEADLIRARDRKTAGDLLLAGAFSMIALYVFVLWLQRRDPAYLLFVAVALIGLSRAASVGRLPLIAWPEMDSGLLLFGEYLVIWLFMAVYPQFLGTLYPAESPRLLRRVWGALGLGGAAVVVLAPPHLFTLTREPFQLLMVVLLIQTIVIAALAVARGRAGAGWLAVSVAILVGAIMNDILYFQRIIPTTDLAPLGVMLFLLGHALVLGRRLNGTFTEVENLSRRLADLNRGLEERVSDVTRDLRDERDRLQAILTNVPDGILTFDERGRVGTFSPAAERLFGRTAREVSEKPLADLLGEETVQLLAARLFDPARTAARPAVQELETDARRLDGRTFPAAVSASRATLGGRPVGVVAVRDVAQRRRAEAALARAKEDAEEAVAARSEFLATMSHEIRTPLNGMLGMVELLRGTTLDEVQRDYVDTVDYSGRALLTILDDVLDASRIEAGRMELEEMSFALPRLVRSVADLMTPRASAKGLRVIVDVAPDTPAQVIGDPTRLRQVLLNLVSNAVKFTDQGEVTVRVRVGPGARPDERPDAVWVRFVVRDTGIGIPSAARATLFTRFSQVDASVARRFGGSGLGLFICHRIVTLMGGSIDLHSVEGHGTTFTVAVPLSLGVASSEASSSADSPPADTPPDADLAPLRVLLVEDVLVNQRVATAFLQRCGHEVAVASTGLEAVRMLTEDDPFDLVLLDIRLPDIDGTEVATRLRAMDDPVRAETPIIALTANVFPEDVERYLHIGMNGVIPKPIQRDQFIRAVAAVVEGRPAPRPDADSAIEAGVPWSGEEAPLLDVSFVTERLESLGREGFLPILALGRRSVLRAVDEVAAAAIPGIVDAQTLSKAAHRLAGAASNFGFARLFVLGKLIEGLAEDGHEDEARARAAAMPDVLAQTLTVLDAWMTSGGLTQSPSEVSLEK